MEDYELDLTDTDRREITPVERAFQRFQTTRAKSIVAEEKYKALIRAIMRRKRRVPESAIVKFRSDSRNTLRQEQAAAQGLFTEAVAAIPDNPLLNIYETQALDAIRETGKKLEELDTTGGSRRKRNKSRNKIYSVRKKSKQRRVKSTRRRHKKSTRHHRSKY